jgi:hypothetical protein
MATYVRAVNTWTSTRTFDSIVAQIGTDVSPSKNTPISAVAWTGRDTEDRVRLLLLNDHHDYQALTCTLTDHFVLHLCQRQPLLHRI